jgi:hypothetical protein
MSGRLRLTRPLRTQEAWARSVLLLTLAGCGPKTVGTERATDAAVAAKAPAESPSRQTPTPPMPPGTPVSFDAQLRLVEQVRKLKASEKVRGFRIKEADLVEHLKGSFAREVPEHALAGTEEMLRLLGVVPADFDYQKTVLGLLKEQLAGLYDPRLDAMFVRDHLEGAELEATLCHELVHALQDQAYHLDEFSAWKEDGTDRASALSALAEGDATSAMYDGLFLLLAERTDTEPKTALDLSTAELLVGFDAAADVGGDDGVPPIVRRSLVAPYRDGLLFVQELRRRGDWALVDAAFKQPPASTEQILHIDRYLAHEAPLELQVLQPPGSGFEKTLSDIWGEQSIRLLFEEWHERPAASAHAAGWGGDRIAVFSREQERILTWHIALDDEAAAQRYFRAFAGKTRTTGDQFCEPRGDLGPLIAARHGAHLVLLAGPRGAKAGAAGDACAEGLSWTKQQLAALAR